MTRHLAVPVPGATLHAASRGEAGPRVLLIMGFGMPGIAWQPEIDRLAPTHRVAWYDTRGIGRSTFGRGPLSMATLADDAVAVMDRLDWPEATVVGVSMGGMVAQHVALRHRARVHSLVLIATHPGGWFALPPGPDGIRGFLRANRARGDARLDALRTLLYPPGARDVRRADPGLEALARNPAPRRVRLAQLGAIAAHDVRDRLPELAGIPTWVLRPDLDILVPPDASDALAAAIPGARLLTFPEAGHGVTVQCANAVSECIAEAAARNHA